MILRAIIMIATFVLVESVRANTIDLGLRFNSVTQRYEVYARPDFDNEKFILGGGSQITVVVPAMVPDAKVVVQGVEGGAWRDDSSVYSPMARPEYDFHGIASDGGIIRLKRSQETLLFVFVVNVSTSDIRLYRNLSVNDCPRDPDSRAKGMGGGDFSIYIADALLQKDHYGLTFTDPAIANPNLCRGVVPPDPTALVISKNGGMLELRWTGKIEVGMIVESSDALSGPWNRVEIIPNGASELIHLFSPTGSRKFFRVLSTP